jgi:hypothetical protein
MDSELDYDLSSLVPRGRDADSGVRAAFSIVAIAGVIAVVSGGAFAIFRGPSALPVAILIFGFGFLVVGVAVRYSGGLWVRRIHVAENGIMFTLTNGRTRFLSWSDPKLELYLWDRSHLNPTSSTLRGRASPFSIASASNIGAPGVITKEIHGALIERFRAQGLSVDSDTLSSGPDAGAARTIITGRHPA